MEMDVGSSHQQGEALEKYRQQANMDSGYESFCKNSRENIVIQEEKSVFELTGSLHSFTIGHNQEYKNEQIVQYPNIEKTVDGLTASLHSFTIDHIQKDKNEQIIQYLKKAFTPDEDNDTYLTILLAKNEVSQALQLIEVCPRSYYLDIQNNLGQAGIHVAAFLNIAHAVHKLIMKGARLDTIDNDGKSIFHICAEHGHLETLLAILDAGQKTNQLKKMWKLLHEQEYTGFTPFFLAVSKKHIDICQALAQIKVNIHITDCRNGNSPLHEAVIPDHADPVFVQFLLDECKLDVNHQNFNGVTPLHVAASKNDKAICSVLLLHRANVNITDMMGYRPVNYTSDEEIIRYLQNRQ